MSQQGAERCPLAVLVIGIARVSINSTTECDLESSLMGGPTHVMKRSLHPISVLELAKIRSGTYHLCSSLRVVVRVVQRQSLVPGGRARKHARGIAHWSVVIKSEPLYIKKKRGHKNTDKRLV